MREWRTAARCLAYPAEIWFDDTETAVRVCRSCPVWRSCLGEALRTGAAHGVWGGFTPQQRRQLDVRDMLI